MENIIDNFANKKARYRSYIYNNTNLAPLISDF